MISGNGALDAVAADKSGRRAGDKSDGGGWEGVRYAGACGKRGSGEIGALRRGSAAPRPAFIGRRRWWVAFVVARGRLRRAPVTARKRNITEFYGGNRVELPPSHWLVTAQPWQSRVWVLQARCVFRNIPFPPFPPFTSVVSGNYAQWSGVCSAACPPERRRREEGYPKRPFAVELPPPPACHGFAEAAPWQACVESGLCGAARPRHAPSVSCRKPPPGPLRAPRGKA